MSSSNTGEIAIRKKKIPPPKFKVEKLGTYKTATERQIAEALEIEKGAQDELLNSKSEWGNNKIPRQKVPEEIDPTPHPKQH